MDRRAYFIEEMNKWNIELNEDQIEKFIAYYELLVEWNSFMNLTGITDFSEVVIKHFVDSLSLVKAVDLSKGLSLIDVGTGAGFPGIPLKIAFPQLNITLLDSLQKRINFLNHVIESIKLENIETIHGRAEECSRPGRFREAYDLCVSRAVASLSVLSEYCLPYVKIGGYFIAYKSGKSEGELSHAKKVVPLLGGKFNRKIDFFIGNNIYRSLVIIHKDQPTSECYPRKIGFAVKKPLSSMI